MDTVCNSLINYSNALKRNQIRNLLIMCLIIVMYKQQTWNDSAQGWITLGLIIIYSMFDSSNPNKLNIVFAKKSYLISGGITFSVFVSDIVRGHGFQYITCIVDGIDDLLGLVLVFLSIFYLLLEAQEVNTKSGLFKFSFAFSICVILFIGQFCGIQYAVTLPQMIYVLIVGKIIESAFCKEKLTEVEIYQQLIVVGYIIFIMIFVIAMPFWDNIIKNRILARNTGNRSTTLMVFLFYVMIVSCLFNSMANECFKLKHKNHNASIKTTIPSLFKETSDILCVEFNDKKFLIRWLAVFVTTVLITITGVSYMPFALVSFTEFSIFTLIGLTVIPVNILVKSTLY